MARNAVFPKSFAQVSFSPRPAARTDGGINVWRPIQSGTSSNVGGPPYPITLGNPDAGWGLSADPNLRHTRYFGSGLGAKQTLNWTFPSWSSYSFYNLTQYFQIPGVLDYSAWVWRGISLNGSYLPSAERIQTLVWGKTQNNRSRWSDATVFTEAELIAYDKDGNVLTTLTTKYDANSPPPYGEAAAYPHPSDYAAAHPNNILYARMPGGQRAWFMISPYIMPIPDSTTFPSLVWGYLPARDGDQVPASLDHVSSPTTVPGGGSSNEPQPIYFFILKYDPSKGVFWPFADTSYQFYFYPNPLYSPAGQRYRFELALDRTTQDANPPTNALVTPPPAPPNLDFFSWEINEAVFLQPAWYPEGRAAILAELTLSIFYNDGTPSEGIDQLLWVDIDLVAAPDKNPIIESVVFPDPTWSGKTGSYYPDLRVFELPDKFVFFVGERDLTAPPYNYRERIWEGAHPSSLTKRPQDPSPTSTLDYYLAQSGQTAAILFDWNGAFDPPYRVYLVWGSISTLYWVDLYDTVDKVYGSANFSFDVLESYDFSYWSVVALDHDGTDLIVYARGAWISPFPSGVFYYGYGPLAVFKKSAPKNVIQPGALIDFTAPTDLYYYAAETPPGSLVLPSANYTTLLDQISNAPADPNASLITDYFGALRGHVVYHPGRFMFPWQRVLTVPPQSYGYSVWGSVVGGDGPVPGRSVGGMYRYRLPHPMTTFHRAVQTGRPLTTEDVAKNESLVEPSLQDTEDWTIYPAEVVVTRRDVEERLGTPQPSKYYRMALDEGFPLYPIDQFLGRVGTQQLQDGTPTKPTLEDLTTETWPIPYTYVPKLRFGPYGPAQGLLRFLRPHNSVLWAHATQEVAHNLTGFTDAAWVGNYLWLVSEPDKKAVAIRLGTTCSVEYTYTSSVDVCGAAPLGLGRVILLSDTETNEGVFTVIQNNENVEAQFAAGIPAGYRDCLGLLRAGDRLYTVAKTQPALIEFTGVNEGLWTYAGVYALPDTPTFLWYAGKSLHSDGTTHRVWVLLQGTDAVRVFDAENPTTYTDLTVSSPVYCGATWEEVFVLSADGTLTFYDPDTLTASRAYPTAVPAGTPWVEFDGHWFVYPDKDRGRLYYLRDTGSGLLPPSAYPSWRSVAAPGTDLLWFFVDVTRRYVVRGDGKIYTFLDTRELDCTETVLDHTHPESIPDGSTAATPDTLVVRDATGAIYATDFLVGSSATLKEVIEEAQGTSEIDFIRQAKVVEYLYKHGGDRMLGVVAEDTPPPISTGKAVDLPNLVGYLLAGVKNLWHRLRAVERALGD